MTSANHGPRWKYERGVHRLKHCWSKPEPGFVPGGRGAIGKCPNTLTDQAAETLLNAGVPVPDGAEAPKYIYAVHDGVIYEAAPTQKGSFHGYPWRGTIPERVLLILKERAENSGHGQAFKKWVDKYRTER